jgi:hypothetical protein
LLGIYDPDLLGEGVDSSKKFGNKNCSPILIPLIWKAIWKFLKKLQVPALPILGIYLKEYMSAYSKDTWAPMIIAALCTIAKLWNQLR